MQEQVKLYIYYISYNFLYFAKAIRTLEGGSLYVFVTDQCISCKVFYNYGIHYYVVMEQTMSLCIRFIC